MAVGQTVKVVGRVASIDYITTDEADSARSNSFILLNSLEENDESGITRITVNFESVSDKLVVFDGMIVVVEGTFENSTTLNAVAVHTPELVEPLPVHAS